MALSHDVATADEGRPTCRRGRRQRRANLAVLQQAALRHFKSLLEEGGGQQRHSKKLKHWLKDALWDDLESSGDFVYLVCSPFHKEMYVGETGHRGNGGLSTHAPLSITDRADAGSSRDSPRIWQPRA